MSDTPTPSYERPPVIEVVCGVQFEPLPRFQATALGLFWGRLKNEYPKAQEMAPLLAQVERFGAQTEPEQQIRLLPTPVAPRMFFVQSTQNWLMQVQKDRLLHNWRQVQDGDTYPRFPEVFDKFWHGWEQFQRFCSDEDLGSPDVTQLEIAYINHIPEGEGWQGVATIGDVFPDIAWRANRGFLPEPESISWGVTMPLPDRRGRLRVSVKHATRKRDNKTVLLCELIARGVPPSTDSASIREWFDMGHEWIVRGFADLASDRIQNENWLRKG